jgi:hypothetical protein
MAALDAAIHAGADRRLFSSRKKQTDSRLLCSPSELAFFPQLQFVDGRDEPGHDGQRSEAKPVKGRPTLTRNVETID